MCAALLLTASIPPLLRKSYFGPYQLENKNLWEGRRIGEQEEDVSLGRDIAPGVVISSFLISMYGSGQSASRN
jgi:hypothetical protein